MIGENSPVPPGSAKGVVSRALERGRTLLADRLPIYGPLVKRLADTERALAETQRLTSIGSFECEIRSGVTTWSDEMYRIAGLSPDTDSAGYESWLLRAHPDDRGRIDATVRSAYAAPAPHSFVHRVVRPDGHVRTIEIHVRFELDESGAPTRMLGTAQDITAFKLAEDRFRGLLETAPDGMVIVDEAGRIVFVNSQTELLFGYHRAELIDQPVGLLVPSRHAHALLSAFRGDQGAQRRGVDLPALRKDGTEFPVEISLSPLQTEQGSLVSAAVRDVTERKLAADALVHQARHDPLTGLPNRTLFLDRLEHALARAKRSRTTLAVLFLDLDDFKLVNDTRGHDAGDLLLVELTPRLSAALRPGDTVARFGGDEFVVLCEDLGSEADAVYIAERIAKACARPLLIGEHEYLVTISAGVMIVDAGDATPTDVLRDADAAMYRAKAGGKGRVEVFDEAMRARLVERVAVEAELRRALKHDELRLFYQPVVSLSTGDVVGVEALLRWQHPERGLLSPADFMHVAESSGLIVPVGEWVIGEACRQAAAWPETSRRKPITVSVNLSPRQVARSDVADAVAVALRSTGLDPSRLELEITEGTLLQEDERPARALHELKSSGVRLVLDDFGTGYSSLSSLKRFTIDALKIDRSFIEGLDHDGEDDAIVNVLLSVAHALDVGVTAEGVETAAQLARLRSRGCRFAQGYLFSPPLPPDELDQLLAEGAARQLLAV